jgi:hypothetical protein
VDRQHLQYARDLVVRCQSELLISISLSRLESVEIWEVCQWFSWGGYDEIEIFHSEGTVLAIFTRVNSNSKSKIKRWECELEIYRSLSVIPMVKLPIDNPPPDYWSEEDRGKIQETEEYPLPHGKN